MASRDPLAPDYVQPTPANPKALVGFVLSVVGLLFLYLPVSAFGTIFGFLAAKEIDRTVDGTGYNFMLGAKVFGILGVVIGLLAFLMVVLSIDIPYTPRYTDG